MAHNLIQVGNSSAIIIPARIIKKRNYTAKTEFDIVEVSDGIKLVQKTTPLENLIFPKIARPVISEEIKAISGKVKLSQEDIDKDERLQYILSR